MEEACTRSTEINRTPTKITPTNTQRVTRASSRNRVKFVETDSSKQRPQLRNEPETKEPAQVVQETGNNHNKMNQQTIQQSITSIVPEFSGENGKHTEYELNKFLDTADSIFEGLTTANEKEIFAKIIKFRLTGEAYAKVASKNIKMYEELKKTLRDRYTQTYSLTELETTFHTTQQKYNESIRSYGHRLTEALDKYKQGYNIKYGQETNDTHSKYLRNNAVQIFKRGLINNVLKEKMATSRAKDIEEIIEEAEVIEKMLINSTNIAHTERIQKLPEKTQEQGNGQNYQTNTRSTICNYCNKPNHTWDVCRTRINQKTNNNFSNQQRPFNTYPNKFNTTQPIQNTYQQRPFNSSFQQPQSSNFIQYRQPQQRYFAPKYCSHCKTTTGHTFEECRSKFFKPTHNYTSDHPRQSQPQPQNRSNLEESFTNLRINQINPHQRPPERNETQIAHMNPEYMETRTNPENYQGSSPK